MTSNVQQFLPFNDFHPSIDDLKAIYREAFRYYHPRRDIPPVHISFYPYVGINHTIRLRDGELYVRIGEICREMPTEPHRGLAYILTGKILRRKIPEDLRDVYENYIDSPELRADAQESRRTRGRKVVTTSKGEHYDLDEIFAELNEKYFAGRISKPVLTWSARKTFHILGHHDATHDHISISRSLDGRNIPRFVVEYVVFHEMLHIAHPAKYVNGRRYHHTPEFKKDERRFTHFTQAEKWIEDNVRNLRRAARRK